MGLLDELFDTLRTAVTGRRSRRQDDVRPASEDPYGDPADQERGGSGNVRPASEDPYCDPADRVMYGNVRPASEDPYGDPADQGFGNVRPASEDPYGDPADEEERRRRR
jgi:hypothetical protein